MPVFFGIRAIAVAVFEIDSKIFYRLALQLCDGSFEHRTCELAARQSQTLSERRRIGCVGANQVERIRTQPRRRFSLE